MPQIVLYFYRCLCKDGFKQKRGAAAASTGKNIVCEDVNECQEIQGICQHRWSSLKTTIWKFSPVPLKWFRWLFRCTNLWGSYKCHCRPGYRLAADKRSCVDIDECSEYGVSSGSSLGLCIGQVSSLSPAQIFLLVGWSLSNKKKKLTAISYFVLLFLGCFESREPIVFQAFRIQGQMAQSWYR